MAEEKTLAEKKHPDWKLHDKSLHGWYLHNDVKEHINRAFKKLSDDKKLCCVYINGDDIMPCNHASNYIKQIFKEEFGELIDD